MREGACLNFPKRKQVVDSPAWSRYRSAGKWLALASSYWPRSPDCREARRWDEMRATHQGRGKARRRSCDRSPPSWLDASFPAAADFQSSLTTHVLQNNPPCQDVEFNFAVRNWVGS